MRNITVLAVKGVKEEVDSVAVGDGVAENWDQLKTLAQLHHADALGSDRRFKPLGAFQRPARYQMGHHFPEPMTQTRGWVIY